MSDETKREDGLSPDEDLIQKFLEKDLSEEEAVIFKRKIEGEAAFAEEVRINLEMIAALRAQGEVNMTNETVDRELDQQLAQIPVKSPISRSLSRVLVGLAAAFVLLIAYFFYLYFSPTQQLDSEQLFAKYYQLPDSRLLTTMSGAHNEKEIYQAFKLLYDQQAFDRAVLAYEQLSDEKPKQDIYFLYGAALFELRRYREAKQVYQTVIENAHPDQHRATWYLALLYLKDNDLVEARQYLQAVIQQEKEFNVQEARDLLSSLPAD
ncbi:MAG: tetratricopeptide repeat protein [Bacteroidota bacterium]